MDNQQIQDLMERFQTGKCTRSELVQVRYLVHEFRENEPSGLSELELESIREEMQTAIDRELAFVVLKPKRLLRLNVRWAVLAAAGVAFMVLFVYFFKDPLHYKRFANDIGPGSNKAFLVLNGGERIRLEGANIGLLAMEADTRVVKTGDGKIVYTDHPGGASIAEMNRIETPRGGNYKISLPDGTMIWLNAASTLTYPISFNGRGERRVKLSGEAYFEVSKDRSKPFLVESNGQVVEVLGTHFDVRCYADDNETRTALLEGSVRLITPPVGPPSLNTVGKSVAQRSVVLKPGDMALNLGAKIGVRQADVVSAVAWKDGEFSFRNESMENIMKQISRWYDVEVVFENNNTAHLSFGGSISKYEDLSSVLHMLELTGDVKFKLEGREVTVL
ncbi:FecR family protein [Pedobacter nutrimenti]|uniref:FecR family protein n=1 Tax=Pedobacter nutrimenti TaxID=1241337 RepID=UPI00292CB778|nr:FecR domain-containing protein [Pedobacter nutrimenti]